MTKTAHGFLHVHYGKDMDGTSKTFKSVKDHPQTPGMSEEELAEHQREVAGWLALCEVEPDAGWIGPFKTEAEAIRAATNEDALLAFLYAQDEMNRVMSEEL